MKKWKFHSNSKSQSEVILQFHKDYLQSKVDIQKSERIRPYTMEDFQALRDLMLLLEENEEPDAIRSELPPIPVMPTPIPTAKLKLKFQRFPDLMTNPNVWALLLSTVTDIKRMTITPRHKD